jgi:hypothetical protein
MGNFDHRVSPQVYLMFFTALIALFHADHPIPYSTFRWSRPPIHEFHPFFVTSEGGFFQAILSFPLEFPLLPPKLRFKTPMWHPNSEHIDWSSRFTYNYVDSLRRWHGVHINSGRLVFYFIFVTIYLSHRHTPSMLQEMTSMATRTPVNAGCLFTPWNPLWEFNIYLFSKIDWLLFVAPQCDLPSVIRYT